MLTPEERKSLQREKYRKNRKREIARVRKWQAENKERCRINNALWYKRNREQHYKRYKKWKKLHHERYLALQRNWRKKNRKQIAIRWKKRLWEWKKHQE
jgi:hypothetical protein